jgi:hypothetical protein
MRLTQPTPHRWVIDKGCETWLGGFDCSEVTDADGGFAVSGVRGATGAAVESAVDGWPARVAGEHGPCAPLPLTHPFLLKNAVYFCEFLFGPQSRAYALSQWKAALSKGCGCPPTSSISSQGTSSMQEQGREGGEGGEGCHCRCC